MKVCVFCGSATGKNPVFREMAKRLGHLLSNHQISLVYGGGNVGLMGVVADAVLETGGEVIGIIPDFLLRREVGHQSITRLEVVGSMHERKKRMADLADAFIALPGGWGTLDELAEILTWRQLDLTPEPVLLINTNGFFDPLLAQMQLMLEEGFLRPEYSRYLNVFSSPEEAVQFLLKNV